MPYPHGAFGPIFHIPFPANRGVSRIGSDAPTGIDSGPHASYERKPGVVALPYIRTGKLSPHGDSASLPTLSRVITRIHPAARFAAVEISGE